jgi:hypothetical protein
MRENFERIAVELNAWLFVIAIGLAVFDLTVLVAKSMPFLPTGSAALRPRRQRPRARRRRSPPRLEQPALEADLVSGILTWINV